MMIRLRFLALAALLVAPFTAAAVAADAPPAAAPAAVDALAQIRSSHVVRIGLTGDYDPYSVIDASGAFHGMDVDAAALLASAIGPGVSVKFVKTTWPTMNADLAAGKFDIAMGGVSRSKERAETGELTHAYLADGKVALIRAADQKRFVTLADLDHSGVTVLVNPGGTNQRFVDANIRHAKVVVVNDNLAIPGMVADGKGDVMFTDGVEALLKAKADPRLYVVSPDRPYTRVEKVYFCGKGQTALLDFLNSWIDKMTASGDFAKLRQKWIGA